MLRSKSRSEERKTHYSSLISVSKFCKGDAIGSQVDENALKSVSRNSSSDVSNFSKARVRAMLMQLEEMEEELQGTKEKLDVSEMEKFQLLDRMEEVKDESNITAIVAAEEIRRFKTSVFDSENDRKVKDERIKSLEQGISEKEEILRDLKEREKRLMLLLSENEKRILELQNAIQAKIDSRSFSGEEDIRNLRNELQEVKQKLAQAEEKEKRMNEEMELLKSECKKGEEAMDGFAFALKEVNTEIKHVKESLEFKEDELQHVRIEADRLKEIVRSNEEKYQKQISEAKKEAELQRNIADRYKLEADESLLAWNEKEIGFVSCIKRAEEEKSMAQNDSRKLIESVRAAENEKRAAKEENIKLRDILKQAISEANAAKAAAGIAREENSFLKDCLADKEEALLLLSKENERYRISEAAANENIKQLRILLSAVSSDCMDRNQSELLMFTAHLDGENEGKSINKTFSVSLEDLKFLNGPEDEIILHEDPVKAEALRGSIFDTNAETPKSEPRTPQAVFTHHRRRHSYALSEGGMSPNSEDYHHLDSGHDDSDSDKHSHRRVKTMFRRVGDLLTIRRGGIHKKDASIDSVMIVAHSPHEK